MTPPPRPASSAFLSHVALVLLTAITLASGFSAWIAGSGATGAFPQPPLHLSELAPATLLFSAVAGIATMGLLLRWRNVVSATFSEQQRRESSQRASRDYHRLFLSAAEPMVVLGPEGQRVLDLNHAASRAFDAPRELFLGQSPGTLHHDGAHMAQCVRAVLAGGQPREYELAHHRRDGTRTYFRVSVTRIEFQDQEAVLCVYRDVSEQRATERQLTARAFNDPLTGLANRTLFRDRVEHAITQGTRLARTTAVLFLDLDNFKTVNDSLGHAAGDRLLMQVAERISRCVRVTDTVARLGGDEFAILMEQVDYPEDPSVVAGRIAAAFRHPFTLEGVGVSVSTSIGIASAQGGDNVEVLLRNADAAMYIAKSRGKGCFEFYEPSMHQAGLEREELERDLRRAMHQGEFALEYQPILNLRTGKVAGAEALVRWRHPERGTIAPGAFIPLAEETGLIVPLGQWVIEEACRQARRWEQEHPEHPLVMTVNVSGRQIDQGADPDLVSIVTEALRSTGLRADRLVLEITEAVLIHHSEGILERLQALHDLGVRIALDDFGSGYSSLAQLHRFPVDILKIDRDCTAALGAGEAVVARAIVALGSILQIQTIAEGVGADQQVIELLKHGCEIAQGFHLARPLTPGDFHALLQGGGTLPHLEAALA